jgi:hypothetical protein
MTTTIPRAKSWLLPDTTLHPLNGEFVVKIVDLPKHTWMSPDAADALADSLKEAAAMARRYCETDYEDDE